MQTEKAYLYWIKFFIRWHGRDGPMRHPREMGATEVEAFLTMLATERRVSTSTHNQALSAVLFLYREVLNIDLPWLNGVNRPTQKRRIPSVLTRDEVSSLFRFLDGQMLLLAQLLYGTGMRLMEGLRLRIKDVDFHRRVIIVREAKGGKDRVVMLPQSLAQALHSQLLQARAVWDADQRAQRGGVETPHALEQKYPKVGQTWGWFWLFPSPTLSVDPRSGVERRHHLFEERLQEGYPCAEGGGRRHGQPAGCVVRFRLIAARASHFAEGTRTVGAAHHRTPSPRNRSSSCSASGHSTGK